MGQLVRAVAGDGHALAEHLSELAQAPRPVPRDVEQPHGVDGLIAEPPQPHPLLRQLGPDEGALERGEQTEQCIRHVITGRRDLLHHGDGLGHGLRIDVTLQLDLVHRAPHGVLLRELPDELLVQLVRDEERPVLDGREAQLVPDVLGVRDDLAVHEVAHQAVEDVLERHDALDLGHDVPDHLVDVRERARLDLVRERRLAGAHDLLRRPLGPVDHLGRRRHCHEVARGRDHRLVDDGRGVVGLDQGQHGFVSLS